jgi:hypothetical protein
MIINGDLPSGYVEIAIENGTFEIVGFTDLKNGWIFQFVM